LDPGQDLAALTELITQAYARSPVPIGGSWSPSALQRELDVGHSLGCWRRGVLAAAILFREISTDRIEVTVLATHPQFWRQGLMAELLETLTDKQPRLWLETHEANVPALTLYRKLGFQEVGRRRGYYNDGSASVLLAFERQNR
jgi:ribosomal protein S18 acetylase RimI-like enzyme